MAYSTEEENQIFDDICLRIEDGESLRSVLRDPDMPSSRTFFKWMLEDEIKVKQYATSTSARADSMFDEMMDIADTPMEGEEVTERDDGTTSTKRGDMLGHRKLQIDSRKWALSKMNPKKYGDKVENVNLNTNMNVDLNEDQKKEALARVKKGLNEFNDYE